MGTAGPRFTGMSGRRGAGIIVMTLAIVAGVAFAMSEVLAGEFPARPLAAVAFAGVGLVVFARGGGDGRV